MRTLFCSAPPPRPQGWPLGRCCGGQDGPAASSGVRAPQVTREARGAGRPSASQSPGRPSCPLPTPVPGAAPGPELSSTSGTVVSAPRPAPSVLPPQRVGPTPQGSLVRLLNRPGASRHGSRATIPRTAPPAPSPVLCVQSRSLHGSHRSQPPAPFLQQPHLGAGPPPSTPRPPPSWRPHCSRAEPVKVAPAGEPGLGEAA